MKLPFHLGGFGTVLADPPWHFADQAGRMRCPYPTMRAEEILALPVDTLGSDRSHLYLWTTDSHLELALACVCRWGFEFKACIVWVKTTSDGQRIRFGGGHYVRKAHELCLFAARQRCPVKRHDAPSVIMAPRQEHSRKPIQFHELAESLSPGPRIELFARRARAGWRVWGNEAPATEVAS